MPEVCDFTLVVDDSPVTIGDADPEWEKTFNTGGRNRNSPAFLIFNVRYLTHTRKDVDVRINNDVVGQIYNYYPGGSGVNETDVNDPNKNRQADHYYTQMIAMSGGGHSTTAIMISKSVLWISPGTRGPISSTTSISKTWCVSSIRVRNRVPRSTPVIVLTAGKSR